MIENTVGAGIFGSMMTFGTNVAEAGREDPHFSPSDPRKIDVIHFLVLKKGETPVGDDALLSSLRMVDQAMVVDESSCAC